MKKIAALLTALLLLCAAAMADEEAFTLRNGVTFGMSMDEVIASEAGAYYEIDYERTRGPVSFVELEYEHMTENGVRTDIKYIFANEVLVAVCFEYETRDIAYNALKADLAEKYGAAGPLDMSVLKNGIYAVDDDGRIDDPTEAIVYGTTMIVLEYDRDDTNVTFIDLGAAYVG